MAQQRSRGDGPHRGNADRKHPPGGRGDGRLDRSGPLGARVRLRPRDDSGRGNVSADRRVRRLSSDGRAADDVLHADRRRDGRPPIPVSGAGRRVRRGDHEGLRVRPARHDVDLLAHGHQQREHRCRAGSEEARHESDRLRLGRRGRRERRRGIHAAKRFSRSRTSSSIRARRAATRRCRSRTIRTKWGPFRRWRLSPACG